MKRMIRLIICLLTVLVLLVSSACVTNEYTGAPPTLSPATEETTSEEETTEDAAETAEADPEPVSGILGLFLGVQDYGSTETVNKANAASFRYRFFAQGRETTYRIGIGSGNDAYALQNRLQEGELFLLTQKNGTITDLQPVGETDAAGEKRVRRITDEGIVTDDKETLALPENVPILRVLSEAGGATLTPDAVKKGDRIYLEKRGDELLRVFLLPETFDYDPPVKGIPGEKTLKNLLATALTPVGVCNYMFGGGWDWQDEGSGPQSTTIGLCSTWSDFFFRQDENYSYRDPYGDEGRRDKAHSYCPFGEFNEYYYAGLDCAGYLAWVAYNVMHNESGEAGYVVGGTPTAGSFAGYGWGTFTQTFTSADFSPGSVMSINGHVWICIGVCADGSMVIAHASPTKSVTGCPGGGVQLSAIGGSKGCEAYRLASEYTTLFYPEWARRYDVSLFDYGFYTSFSGDVAGLFNWDLTDGVLTDPDGYREKTAYEVLSDLYGYDSALDGVVDSEPTQEGTTYEETTAA